MALKKKRAGAVIEWAGGLFAMPTFVTGEGEPYRPESLVWMDSQGAVVGFATDKPGALLAKAAAHLLETTVRPIFGLPHAPTRVRVSSRGLAAALLEGLPPNIEVLCAPTPEIDRLLDAMATGLHEEAVPTYLSPGLEAAALGAFFRAAARLFRAAPWKVLPSDQSVLAVTIEELGLRDARLSVIGQMGQHHGLVLFSGDVDFHAFLDAAAAVQRGEEPDMPPHFAINFERGADLGPARRAEVARHGWEVASAAAYPWVVVADEDLVTRPPTATELTLAEATALALTEAIADPTAMLVALEGGEPFTRSYRVKTHAGDVTVQLGVPGEAALADGPPFDLLADLADLEGDGGEELDQDARRELEDELVADFAASPEGESFAEAQWVHLVMDLAADHFGATIGTSPGVSPRRVPPAAQAAKAKKKSQRKAASQARRKGR